MSSGKQFSSFRTVLVGLLALYLYTAFALSALPWSLSSSVDSVLYRRWSTESFRYASSVFDLSIISPVQGLGGLTTPYGVWLHPAFLPGSLVGHWINEDVVNYFVIIVAYCTAIYFLGRSVGLSSIAAIIGAQIAGIVCFPPIWFLFFRSSIGFCSHLEVSPAQAFPTILGTLFVAIFLVVGSRRPAPNVVCIVVPPVLILYSVACDPMYTTCSMFAPGFLLCGALVCSQDRRQFFWRLGALAICLAVFLLANLPRLYWAYSRYSARVYFPNEIGSSHFQQFDNSAAWLFHGPLGCTATMLLIAICIALVWFGKRNEKAIGLSVLGFQAFVIGLSLIFVYAGINWVYPAPYYFELGAVPAYTVAFLLGAQLGWPRFVTFLYNLGPRSSTFIKQKVSAEHLAYGSVIVAPFVASLVVLIQWMIDNQPAQQTYQPSPIVNQLVKDIAVYPNSEFRGSVVTIGGIPGSPIARRLDVPDRFPRTEETDGRFQSYVRETFDRHLDIRGLWLLDVPTLEHNSQLITAPRYYLFSRALARNSDYQYTNHSLASVFRPKLMAALGARYLLTDVDLTTNSRRLDLTHRATATNSENLTLWLYEFARPNTGKYSPTQIRVSKTAREIVRQMISDQFSFEDEVILDRPLPAQTKLVRANEGRIFFERGGVRIRGKSSGTSLLVLPLEYSHSLKIVSSESESRPQLLRANLLQTGVLFSGYIDVKIAHIFGLFRETRGRILDIADCRSLEMEEDGEVVFPLYRMPHAWKTFPVTESIDAQQPME